MTDLIRIETRGHIQIWTLDRAGRLNALPDLGDEVAFADACSAANADLNVRCVVLTGAGRAFSAGGDLKAMRDKTGLFAGDEADIRDRYQDVVHRIVRSLYRLDVPLIAAVNGPAMGLGCDITGLADIRIASDRATFGLPFLKLGIVPGDGGGWITPRYAGYARAAELLFTGKSIDAATASDWGLVSRVVSHEALMEEALAMAGQIAAQAPLALRETKRLLRLGRTASFDEVLAATAKAQAAAHMSADHAEGVAAVLEKRPARFEGR